MPTSTSQNETYDLDLLPRWNLTSAPVDPLTSDVSELFNELSISDITYWDNEVGSYKVTTHLKPNIGYWFFSHDHLTVKIEGKRPTQIEIALGMGWNLVGVTNAIRPVDYNISIDTIWGWDAGNQSYVSISPEDYLVPGQGYWVYSPEEFNLKISQ